MWMKMNDVVGMEKVICVDDSPCNYVDCDCAAQLTKGAIYTVRGVMPPDNFLSKETGYLLVEARIKLPCSDGSENAYNASRFRPWHSIQRFREIVRAVKAGNRELVE